MCECGSTCPDTFKDFCEVRVCVRVSERVCERVLIDKYVFRGVRAST